MSSPRSFARLLGASVAMLTLGAFWLGDAAHADRPHREGRTIDAAWAVPGAMREGRAVVGPPAHAAFCARAPEHCADSAAATPGAFATLDPAALAALEDFNAGVNRAFHPINDQQFHGVSDYWTLPTSGADCEDYVLYKRARLIDAGWPEEAVLIAVVLSPVEGYHAVLILRTDQGELVLDNLRDEVLEWRETGYEWVIRQSTEDPRLWVEIDAPSRPLLSS